MLKVDFFLNLKILTEKKYALLMKKILSPFLHLKYDDSLKK